MLVGIVWFRVVVFVGGSGMREDFRVLEYCCIIRVVVRGREFG